MYEIELNSLKIEGEKKEKKVTKFPQSHSHTCPRRHLQAEHLAAPLL